MTIAERRASSKNASAGASLDTDTDSCSGGDVIDLNHSPPLLRAQDIHLYNDPGRYLPHHVRQASRTSNSSRPESPTGSVSSNYSPILSSPAMNVEIPPLPLNMSSTQFAANPSHRQNPLLSRAGYRPAASDGMPSPTLSHSHFDLSDAESQSGVNEYDEREFDEYEGEGKGEGEDGVSPPLTPKGHPVQDSYYNAILRSIAQNTVQAVVNSVTNNAPDNIQYADGVGYDSHGNKVTIGGGDAKKAFGRWGSKLYGFLGGGGSGVPRGMKGAQDRDSGRPANRHGKIYKPEPTPSDRRKPSNALSSAQKPSFQTTLSYLARVPRKMRPLLYGIFIFVLTGVVVFVWANDRAQSIERVSN